MGGTVDCDRHRRNEVGKDARALPVAGAAANAAPKVFVAGESAGGTRFLSFAPELPIGDTVVFADDGRYELITVVEAEERYGTIHWLAEPEPLLPPRPASATTAGSTSPAGDPSTDN
ncbi:MAG: hypothetical protein ACOYOQ_15185 [Microthrixaceae bacterium]